MTILVIVLFKVRAWSKMHNYKFSFNYLILFFVNSVKPSLRSSSLSAGSLYYSFEDEANENTDYLATDNLVHLKSMGKRSL